MKHKLKIVPEGGQYIGYALLNDEVVFQTSPCKDTIACSRALSQFVGKQSTTSPVPAHFAQRAIQAPAAPISGASQTTASPRRCCGRG